MVQRLHMRACQIVHMNIVANAGSIRRWIIRSKHLQLGSRPGSRLQSQWNEVRLGIVEFADLPALVCTCCVEVPEAGIAKSISAVVGLKHLLKEQFRHSVG